MRSTIRMFAGTMCGLVLCVAAASAAAPIDGRWSGQMAGPQGTIELVLDLMSSGEDLTGTATFPMFASVPISNGKVTTDAVAFDVVLGDGAFTLPFRGRLDAGTLKLVPQGPFPGDTVAFKRVPAAN